LTAFSIPITDKTDISDENSNRRIDRRKARLREKMTPEEVEQAIATARDNRSTDLSLAWESISILPDSIGDLINLTGLDLRGNELTNLPDKIGNLTNLSWLDLSGNELISLPDSIKNLTNLTTLNLGDNQLISLPDSIGNLTNLINLDLGSNRLTSLPDSIGNLTNLTNLDLFNNHLNSLPDSIGSLTNLSWLCPSYNQLDRLPNSIGNLTILESLDLSNNPLMDLSVLANIPNLETVSFFNVDLPCRYWTKLSEWKAEWLLDEDNVEIKRTLIAQIGYEKICAKLNAITIDTWREYTLLKIDEAEIVYDEDGEPIDTEPMVLLKMTCPSTAHIHILRVPPEMVSAEEAITWVNHGIHPVGEASQNENRFTLQT
jgi:leucine-rich repeat protein SHOC2